MLLYTTSTKPFTQGGDCPMAVCKLRGHTHKHLCFTSEPLPGAGEIVHTIDVSPEDVQQYEYKNDFRSSRVRFFAVPHSLLQTLSIEKDTYEAITGQAWNTWVVPVLDRRNLRAPKLRGKWALVWASRDGIASVRVHRKAEGRGETVFMSVEVTATEDFDPEKDYILAEHHEEFEKEFGSGTKETWRLEMLAGVTPQWALYPKAWQEYVFDDAVVESAAEYIRSIAPSTSKDVDFALRRDSKFNKARAWRLVADGVARELSPRLGRRLDLGKLAGHSWTQVASMPVRIAKRVGTNLPPAMQWVPPREEPVYANPEDSGRRILANLYGAYPQHGPGVDHAPQERPYQGLEGELNDGEGKKGDSPFESDRTDPQPSGVSNTGHTVLVTLV